MATRTSQGFLLQSQQQHLGVTIWATHFSHCGSAASTAGRLRGLQNTNTHRREAEWGTSTTGQNHRAHSPEGSPASFPSLLSCALPSLLLKD